MRVAEDKDKSIILAYLKKQVHDCLYLYIDIVNYGISSDNMTVWIDDINSLSLVVMKYYDSFQVYSHEPRHDMTPVAELLKEYPVAMVSGRDDLIEELDKLCNNYEASYGGIYLCPKIPMLKNSLSIETATEANADEIAALICSDKELGGHYTIDSLASQIRERIHTKTGRSYIIRKDGEIIAHNATYAETSDIAVISGAIVKPEHRNTFYFLLLGNYLSIQLEAEGKIAYAFAITPKAIQYHDEFCIRCGSYGKLVKAQSHL